MKVTSNQVVTLVCFIVGSLLLVFAASCSVDKQAMSGSEHKHSEEDSGEHQVAESAVSRASCPRFEGGTPSTRTGFVANIFCSACHYGFDDEELARTHELAGIGCERCHGESERHRSDEDNVTPPEIMYPKAKINPTCMMCHPRHEISQVASHKALLAGAKTVFDPADEDDNQIYCTDCHAKDHRINVRNIRWNKQTGELLKD
ncbi:MAG TPA: hypothetical protein DIU00_17420 [Phycisphaerales bacterium]|nr:hypothetical protein [Phycisphaerales bacterium]